MFDTLEITLYGGPCSGKSTCASQVFSELKQRGRDVELVHEFAKDLTWEKAFNKLSYQPCVAGEQLWRLEKLKGQVEAVVTDTSTLLSALYGTEENGATPAFLDWLVDDYKRRNTLNFYLWRDQSRGYNPNGRNQSEEEALAVDSRIYDLLAKEAKIDFYIIQMDIENNSHVQEIVGIVERKLEQGNCLEKK